MLLELVAAEKAFHFKNIRFFMKKTEQQIINESTQSEYKYGFVSNIDADTIDSGLNEDTNRLISSKKQEPEWMLEKRLSAFSVLKKMKQPKWANIKYPKIDLQKIIYYSRCL